MRFDGILRREVDANPMQIRGLLLTGLALLACWTLGAGAAGAQAGTESAPEVTEPVEPPTPTGPSSEKTPGIEERVVLAGESEGASDFAAGDSVKGFDAADIEALGAQNIADLARFTPNLEIVTAGSTAPTFFIRGVGLNDFNANSAGAVAIYQDDVPLNSPALQLGTLFDMEGVNVERGPQGTGPFRNASAGAIKLYAHKPTGNYGGFLRSQYGRFNYVDFEGAVEAPVYEDILSSRFAFRFRDRDGWAKNGCGDAPPFSQREVYGTQAPNGGLGANPAGKAAFEARVRAVGVDPARLRQNAQGNYQDSRAPRDPSLSICGESVTRILQIVQGVGESDGISDIEEDLPRDVNSQHDWAARGILRFQPTLDSEWLLNFHGARRDEQSRLGQSAGTRGSQGFFCDPNQPIANCFTPSQDPLNPNPPGRILGVLGRQDAGAYQEPDALEMFNDFNAEELASANCPAGTAGADCRQIAQNNAKIRTAEKIAKKLDKRPYRGDFDRIGKTKNDVWGSSLKGEMVLPGDVELRSVTGYDTYDRFVFVDLDMSPTVLFEIETDDDGWQFTQDLSLGFQPFEEVPFRVAVGGFYLMEELNVAIRNDFGEQQIFSIADRDYTQKIWSGAGYVTASFDFWEDFTLDGGGRYNYDRKSIDYQLLRGSGGALEDFREDDWSEPTGTVRLTYRFREDTHVYWKYTRGWKGGHYNATSSLNKGVTLATPETIDAFETGIRGSWFDGMANMSVNLFYYDYQDYQLFTAEDSFNGQPEFVILNANDARVYGAELDVKLFPHPTLFLNVNVSWLESEFLDFVQVQLARRVVGTQAIPINKEIQNSGNRLLNSPEWKVSLTAEQTLPLGRFGALVGRYDGAWTDDSYYDATEGRGIANNQDQIFLPEDTIGQRAFWLHNVSLRYVDPTTTVEVTGWCRNLTNETYKTFAFDGTSFRETTIYYTADPRTYGITVGVRF